MKLPWLALHLCAVGVGAMTLGRSGGEKKGVRLDGHIVIGGLFPVHEPGGGQQQKRPDTAAALAQQLQQQSRCGPIKSEKGIQRMEAMLYAVDQVPVPHPVRVRDCPQINADESLLPGTKLGVHILDTCSRDTYALEQTLEFIKTAFSGAGNVDQYQCVDGSEPSYSPPTPVAAVIGAASSQIPQISYSSTGAELSEKPRFEYFSRVVPPDNLQAKAISDLVFSLNWTYVQAIADAGAYGENGIENFRRFARARGWFLFLGWPLLPNALREEAKYLTLYYQHLELYDRVCIEGLVKKLKLEPSDADLGNILDEMAEAKATGVVMFVNEDHINRLFRLLDEKVRTEGYKNRFAWIGSDTWGKKDTPVRNYEQRAIGAITLAPDQEPDSGFNEYFLGLGPDNPRNPWHEEFWADMKCTREDATFKACLDRQGLNFKQESYVSYTVEAVTVLARALDAYYKFHCPQAYADRRFESCNATVHGFDGKLLQTYYRNVSFNGERPAIDANGDGVGQYVIYQFQGDKYRSIGHWEDGELVHVDLENENSLVFEFSSGKLI